MSQTNFNSIRLSPTTELRFEVSSFKGKNYINIRQHISSDDFTGYTRKGIAITKELGDQLLAALRSAESIQEPVSEQEICRLPKNSTTELVARIIPSSDKNKSTSFDVREYVQSESYTGWTQKGFRLSLDKLPQVIAYLAECLNQLDRNDDKTDLSQAG